MTKNPNFKLTGGTLLTLLSNSVTTIGARQKENGMKDKNSNQELLKSLIAIGDKDINLDLYAGDSFRTICANYKNCGDRKSPTYLPFVDGKSTWPNEFRKRMNLAINNCLTKTKELLVTHINNDKTIRLFISALYSLIVNDETIDNNSIVYINENKEHKTKLELKTTTKINAAGLLLGAWFYIIDNQIDNKLGKETIAAWHPYSDSELIECPFWFDNTSLDIIGVENKSLPPIEAEIDNEFNDDAIADSDDEEVIEVLEDTKKEEASEDTSPKGTTIIQNSPFIITGGTQTINVHYGDNHITNNYNGKKED